MSEYIEREAAKEAVVKAVGKGHSPFNAIVMLPAADVRPVVRGKWIGNKRHQSCSECHMTYCVPDGKDGELDMTSYHFCPNCGADMREEN